MSIFDDRLRDNLPRVRDRIEAAVRAAGRPDAVTIVGVTKGHPLAAVRAALDAGLTDVGENRVGELEAKHAEISAASAAARSGAEVRWHLIGHLQRNKVRRVLPLFDLLHSVDSLRLARTLSAEAERVDRTVRCLVQVNASGEASKGGFSVGDGPGPIAEVVALPRLHVQGLMTMAPLTDDDAVLRSTFRATNALFEACGDDIPGFDGKHLSMGMTNDFELAVQEGSTMVRLGTVLFGARPSHH